MVKRTGSCGIPAKNNTPAGVPKRTPRTSKFNFCQSIDLQTIGSMKMLATISSKKAVGTTSAGGKINDKLVTARAEKPNPLYPRINAAIKIAVNAYKSITGLSPVNNSKSRKIFKTSIWKRDNLQTFALPQQATP